MFCVLSTRFVRFPQKGGDSVASIATGHGLEGPGMESRWGIDFSAPVQTCPGAHPVSCTLGTGSFSRIKRPARGVHHPPQPSAQVKGRVQLYLYPAFMPSYREKFTFTLCFSQETAIFSRNGIKRLFLVMKA